MFNLLTIDVEDYFQVHAFSRVIRHEDWGKFECRIERSTDRLLSILSSVSGPQPSALKLQSSIQEVNSFPHSLNNPSNPITQRTQVTATPEHGSTARLNSLITHSLNNPLSRGVRATFFILGWIAERYQDLVRRIENEGHEIACHGYAHRLVYTQSRDEFREDVKRSKSILEDITGKEVIGYRAPSYSITRRSQWAFEVLVEEGFKYDSSIFPIRHDFYGMPEAPRFPFLVSFDKNDNVEFLILNVESSPFRSSKLKTHNSQLEVNNSLTHSLINPSSEVSEPQRRSAAAQLEGVTPNSELQTPNSLIEFPISTVKLLGLNFPISGGGYFRLFPYSLIRKGLKGINEKEGKPFIFYIHPWEIDPNQPRINGGSLRSKFRHYVNLNKTENRLQRLLNDFNFSSVKQMLYLDNLITH